jgi:hypothetical protein
MFLVSLRRLVGGIRACFLCFLCFLFTRHTRLHEKGNVLLVFSRVSKLHVEIMRSKVVLNFALSFAPLSFRCPFY